MYTFWLIVFRIALILEGAAVHLRDLAQRRKMALVHTVPEDWRASQSW
jgi:hypothetical protein